MTEYKDGLPLECEESIIAAWQSEPNFFAMTDTGKLLLCHALDKWEVLSVIPRKPPREWVFDSTMTKPEEVI